MDGVKIRKAKYYIASLSGGKDSLAMVLKIIELKLPLTHVIFFDGGMEFKAVYAIIDKIRPIIEAYGAKLIIVKPEVDFLMQMLIAPVEERKTKNIHYGYDWCGGRCRWRTTHKVTAINKYISSLDGDYVQYIGMAVDEPERIDKSNNKIYPLVELNMTEKDCLEYCFSKGWHWKENGIELYSILKRVSCWCCKNKNLDELRNIYHFLPYYWNLLKGMQSRIDRPFHGNKTIFDLEERFKKEDQMLEERLKKECEMGVVQNVVQNEICFDKNGNLITSKEN